VYEIELSLAADLPELITDQEITALKRRAASANLKQQAKQTADSIKQ
jgi:hypothetical protein